MSSQITTAFVQQYSANIQMLSQQMGSLLRDKVRVESVVGKNAFFDQVGSVTAQLRTSRHADTPQVDTCLLYTSPSPRDLSTSRMPSSA